MPSWQGPELAACWLSGPLGRVAIRGSFFKRISLFGGLKVALTV
jgi:hypothetical protein